MSRAEELMPIAARRAAVESEVYEGMELTDEHRSRVTIEERFVPGPADEDGAPDVRVVVYQPNDRARGERLPVILELPRRRVLLPAPRDVRGDGRGAGDAPPVRRRERRLPARPGAPLPRRAQGPLRAALLWTVANADELGIDTSRLVVTGGSVVAR